MNTKLSFIVLFLLSVQCVLFYASDNKITSISQTICNLIVKDINPFLQPKAVFSHPRTIYPLQRLVFVLQQQKENLNQYEAREKIFTAILLYERNRHLLDNVKNSNSFQELKKISSKIYQQAKNDSKEKYE